MFAPRCPKCRSRRVQRAYNDAAPLLRALGINFMLCNNCNAEFKGFALFGAKRSRGRKIEVKNRPRVGNRQRAPRKRTRLNATVYLRHETETRPALTSPHGETLYGYTRDLSRIGLSIVLPDARFTDDYLAQDKHRLLIHLALPDLKGARLVVLHAAAVRYEQLDEDGARTGWLVGARITWIDPAERERFFRFVDSLP